ncbi:hypothetical protein BMETH_71211192337, partial [methanotrophic bacterial endosymbiont of Bathymodiolus sp.]
SLSSTFLASFIALSVNDADNVAPGAEHRQVADPASCDY